MVGRNTKIFTLFWIGANNMIRRGANKLCFAKSNREKEPRIITAFCEEKGEKAAPAY